MGTGDADTDRINLVRFVAGDRLLVSADRDNRVLLRPRKGDEFLDESVEVEIEDE